MSNSMACIYRKRYCLSSRIRIGKLSTILLEVKGSDNQKRMRPNAPPPQLLLHGFGLQRKFLTDRLVDGVYHGSSKQHKKRPSEGTGDKHRWYAGA